MPDIALDLRFLHYAILVARIGSFRAAAESMNLSQSTVSRRIRVLERRLGIELFERDPSGAYLTPAGAKFVEDAERGMTALLRAVDTTLPALNPSRKTRLHSTSLGGVAGVSPQKGVRRQRSADQGEGFPP
jgi:DNA-binding transcriptional LysR family regulator